MNSRLKRRVVADSRRIVLLAGSALVIVLSACGHTPSAADIPSGASFTATVLADGTKLFVYKQPGFRGPPDEAQVGPVERGQHGPTTEQMQKTALRGIVATLAENQYCRTGYMVLEQYPQQRNYVVRGECREPADQADREKFPTH
jgi:hypothetical protein